ncbi:uncharacterized protein SOCEGT47_009510 [Sorangium cellulosum]|uniref:Uncharacterized protein n=1 Tax=Sorangium cellulosum TaxID=56 RepID=A0A4P2PUY4_SORCE|nr:hypothetical protein [Sorangium cellulosum]AUX20479.1 uncharacterized protein SOCEGT47_009510 [Sorangium cellulosum]
MLVSQQERRVEHYRRNEDGTWTLRDVPWPASIELSSIGCTVSLDEIDRDALGAPPTPS